MSETSYEEVSLEHLFEIVINSDAHFKTRLRTFPHGLKEHTMRFAYFRKSTTGARFVLNGVTFEDEGNPFRCAKRAVKRYAELHPLENNLVDGTIWIVEHCSLLPERPDLFPKEKLYQVVCLTEEMFQARQASILQAVSQLDSLEEPDLQF